MHKIMHKIEVMVDKAINPCIIVLLVIIILELGMPDMIESYKLELPINIADYLVLTVFVLDLVFKYLKTRHIPEFLRKYWIDIIAVFPFFLMFRLYEITIGVFSPVLAEGAEAAQKLLHEGLEVEKEGAKIVRETEQIAKEAAKSGKTARAMRFARFLKPLLRLPRLLKAAPQIMHFYEKPSGKHHYRDYMPKHR